MTPQVLETTLRDGSYTLDFQFTEADTRTIAGALDALGFPYIEVGHGIGLGASRNHGEAAASDVAYGRAANAVVRDGRWGMFCIPGIATLDDLRALIDEGMGFVRVGTNAQDAAEAEPFIRLARDNGLWVAANYMKSYTLPPERVARLAEQSADYGADIVYIVDSAGGMLPSEVRAYVEAIPSHIGVGFHGHDNLCLSVANSLAAMEAGADVIDTSLQGLGRSAGNTPTEVFLLAMERMGKGAGYDLMGVMDAGEELVRPLVQRRGHESLVLTTGYALFHSSYMGTIREYAGRYGVDPRALIVAVCEHDRVDAPPELVEREAARLQAEGKTAYLARFRMDRYHGEAA